MTMMRRTKAAWIRDEGYPVGKPAPGHFDCSCGTRVPQVSDENRCLTCGTVYDARGWILDGVPSVCIAGNPTIEGQPCGDPDCICAR
jgi:hypothetical protein